MIFGLDFNVIATNMTYFLIGRYPTGPLGGLGLTLLLAIASVFLSFFGGLILGLFSVSRSRWVRIPAQIFVQVMRGLPLLMVIFWMFFLMPAIFGRGFPEFTTVIAALSIFTSAYMAQIVRAGIDSISKGQWEAAFSLGLSYRQAMMRVVLPQALRNMIPSFVNQFVSLIKDTSLAFIVGVSELTHVATQVNNRTMSFPTEIFIFVAFVYFVLCFAFTSWSRRLERHYSFGVSR